ncbi:MAG: retroviral-like aspartic protease family protein [Akkermansia sp.]|nr:retroviral-like aspartic protease family protein [Akkermansia sp.]
MKSLLMMVALLPWLWCGWAAAEPAAETAPEMYRDAACGQVLVRCTADGVPLLLLLDTGATHTVIDAEVAAQKLPKAYRVDTTGMDIRGNAAGVRPEILLLALEAGEKNFPQQPVLVMPLGGVRAMLREPVDGILGMDVLCRLAYTLDFREGGQSHWGAEDSPTARPMPARPDAGGCPLLSLRCGEKVIPRVLLDTGSSSTVLAPDDWPAGEGAQREVQVADVNGHRTVQLRFGSPAAVQLAEGIQAQVRPQLSEGVNRSSCSGILGVDALRGLRLIYRPDRGFGLIPE